MSSIETDLFWPHRCACVRLCMCLRVRITGRIRAPEGEAAPGEAAAAGGDQTEPGAAAGQSPAQHPAGPGREGTHRGRRQWARRQIYIYMV